MKKRYSELKVKGLLKKPYSLNEKTEFTEKLDYWKKHNLNEN